MAQKWRKKGFWRKDGTLVREEPDYLFAHLATVNVSSQDDKQYAFYLIPYRNGHAIMPQWEKKRSKKPAITPQNPNRLIKSPRTQ
jgi:hypothetical protein